MSQQILVEREQGLLTLRLNRADKMNALTREMYAALADALEAAEHDRGVHVVLIAGNAECFTAGNDIHDFLQYPPSGQDSPVFRFMRALMEFRCPSSTSACARNSAPASWCRACSATSAPPAC
jgi:enoyl-CoA hydratase/carnithine racemase